MTVTTDALWTQTVQCIAEEAGLDAEEINAHDEFASDLGVNDILGRSLAANLTTNLKKEIPATVTEDYPTVEALYRYLQASAPKKTTPSSPTKTVTSPKSKTSTPKSRVPLSVLLQGNPSTSTRTIFLVPDGSGSGMAYATIPVISPDVCLVAMNSPYLTQASEYRCSIEEISRMWVDEVRKRQPKGPYILGGWSAGGYYSYELAKQLISEGERVDKLILLDSPVRPEFEELPLEVVKYLSSRNLMGNWGTKKTPSWLVDHFSSTLRAVHNYFPKAMQRSKMPEVFIIWCREGVLSHEKMLETGLDLNVKVTRFLLEGKMKDGKPNFGPHGWDRLFPGGKVNVATMSGNHFTLINKPYVNDLGPLLADVAHSDPKRRRNQWQTFRG